ncbi:MAG: ribosome biogenesis GTPase Der, partial [Alphaproteobacteria bacterium]
NKCEGTAGEAGYYDAFALGLGEPVAISAEHGEGMGALYDAISAQCAALGLDIAAPGQAEAEKPLFLAIVGRPNAGKSTLINRLVGAERLVVGPEAGITRDSIAIDWSWQGKAVRLFDTAGLRRRAKVQGKLEKLSAADTARAIQFAEVVVLLLDAGLGLEAQDLKIAADVVGEGRALVLALNKWDMVEDPAGVLAAVRHKIDGSFAQLRDVPLVTLSAATGEGVARLMPAAFETHEAWNKRVPTARLNRWLAGTVDAAPPPTVKGRRLKLRYVTQIKARPPTFAFFVNRPDGLSDAYRRFLVNELRRAFGFPGVPVRAFFRAGDNPFAKGGGKNRS